MKVHNHTDQQHEYKAGKDNTVYNNTVQRKTSYI
jgi:hypothetical protein